jgi:hypothetical protein
MNDSPRLGVDDGVEGFDIGEAVQLFAGLRIGIYSEGIGCVSGPCIESFLQNWDLGYGPINGSFSV